MAMWLRQRKCHEIETDLGECRREHTRTHRSAKINMSRGVRPYSVGGKPVRAAHAGAAVGAAAVRYLTEFGHSAHASPRPYSGQADRCRKHGEHLEGPVTVARSLHPHCCWLVPLSGSLSTQSMHVTCIVGV